jgi:hypothetical protein
MKDPDENLKRVFRWLVILCSALPGMLIGYELSVALAPLKPDPTVPVEGSSSYVANGADTPTVWSPLYLKTVPEISVMVYGHSGKNENLTAIVRNGQVEFHNYSVLIENRNLVEHYAMFGIPAGGAGLLAFAALYFYLRDRKSLTANRPSREP